MKAIYASNHGEVGGAPKCHGLPLGGRGTTALLFSPGPLERTCRPQYIQNSATTILMTVRAHRSHPSDTTLLPRLLQDQLQNLPTHHPVHAQQSPSLPQRTASPQRTTAPSNLLMKPPLQKLWSFSSAAPRLWNTLLDHLRAPQTVEAFKKRLQTSTLTGLWPHSCPPACVYVVEKSLFWCLWCVFM